MSEYGKIERQILQDVADALRFQKNSTRQYAPKDFARIIKAMLVLPSSEAVSPTLDLTTLAFDSNSVGALPTVHEGIANDATLDLTGLEFSSTASGTLS